MVQSGVRQIRHKIAMNRWNGIILIVQILVLLVTIFLFVPQFSSELISSDNQGKDAIAVAAQIGRLDVVSLIFAMFGIILALFAFGGFFSIRTHAEHIATKEAREVAERVAAEKVDNLMTSINIKPIKAASASEIDTEDAQQLTGEDNDSRS